MMPHRHFDFYAAEDEAVDVEDLDDGGDLLRLR